MKADVNKLAYVGKKPEKNKPKSWASNEWYIPAEFVCLVSEVLGEIDLDPFSCSFANEVVKANRYYFRFSSGCEQESSLNQKCHVNLFF